MNDVVDVIRLLRLIQGYTARINQYTQLIETMRAEGRDSLTDEELANLKSEDDAARQALQDAIEAH